ncbi:bile acid:sodium symporter family protein [Sulfitobacter sp. PS-8MA]|uniref:bile acid:sodium symporter family protein n=1 Tax=Sulfitobacter sp. PS-8MA TaxID=3237707 RepID=UPI0034C696A2
MRFLSKIGIDLYMLVLLGTVGLGVVLPAEGLAAALLKDVTFWAVALLFFLYGAKLDPSAIRAGLLNWRLQGLSLIATYAIFPLLGLLLVTLFGPLLGATAVLGFLFLAVLPSTIQSSIAFTSIAGGNVPGAICAASLSNLLGVVLTPALVALVLQQDGGGVGFDAVVKIATQILLPFVLGQVAMPWIGGFIRRHRLLSMTVDRGSILLIVYAAFSAGTVSGLWATVSWGDLAVISGVVVVFLALAMGAMVLAGKVCGLPAPDRAALFYCGSTKSLASGLPIASALFAPETVGAIVLPLMIFHMLQLLVCAYFSQQKAAQAMA